MGKGGFSTESSFIRSHKIESTLLELSQVLSQYLLFYNYFFLGPEGVPVCAIQDNKCVQNSKST